MSFSMEALGLLGLSDYYNRWSFFIFKIAVGSIFRYMVFNFLSNRQDKFRALPGNRSGKSSKIQLCFLEAKGVMLS